MHKCIMADVQTDWFKKRKKELEINDEVIGEAIGRDRSIVNKILSGKLPFDVQHLPGFATALKVSPETILYRFGVKLSAPPTDSPPDAQSSLGKSSRAITPIESDHLPTRDVTADDDVAEIIALDLSLSMGPGTLIEEMIEETPVKLDVGLLRQITRSNPAFLRIVRGTGDSMEPTLRPTDRIIIDTSEKMLSRLHGIYWIDYAGAHGLKRLRPGGPGRVWILSDNPAPGNDAFEVDVEELRIHGRAIWCWRDL